MKLNLNSLLKDKNVLRIVAILSVFNLLGYLMVQNLDAVAFFVIIGFLTTYFSKNMIVVLLVAMIATNFLVMSRNAARNNTVEGMENPKESGRDKTKSNSDKKSAPKKPSGPKPDDETEGEQIATGSPSKLDEAATVEAAYENLENMLGSDGIKGMSDETAKLAKRQKELGKMVEQMKPMMDNVNEMLSNMGGMEGMKEMMDNVSPMIEGLGKITSSMAGGKKGGESDLEGFQLMK